MPQLSPLALHRLKAKIELPAILQDFNKIALNSAHIKPTSKNVVQQLVKTFPKTIEQPIISFTMGASSLKFQPLKVGIVLSGGQASGGHNVIAGVFDAMEKLHSQSVLYGFLGGPNGIVTNQYIEITKELLASFRNQGGFDLLGSGRTKISHIDQFIAVKKNVEALGLDGLVIVGGDDSNTNAALLAEYFLAEGCSTKVVGVPKTIDGDIKNEEIEISFGFDSAAKCYSETIGNIAKDAISAKKYYYFIKIMGREASHLALECALQTHPNMALISEEVAANQMSLKDIVDQICDMITARSSLGFQYGIILIPEGIIEFIAEIKSLIAELNIILSETEIIGSQSRSDSKSSNLLELVAKKLTEKSSHSFLQLPKEIREQLLQERDPHGNVQVSKIETERLFIRLVEEELEHRRISASYFGAFAFQSHFCGYEGRSCLPSYFDSTYCYALGHVSALLIAHGHTGYMSALQNVDKAVETWSAKGIPLVSMFTVEERKGKHQPVIGKTLVNLEKEPFKTFSMQRSGWLLDDDYRSPGPIQFYGPKELVEAITYTLKLENSSK